jgi:hypothetical protein
VQEEKRSEPDVQKHAVNTAVIAVAKPTTITYVKRQRAIKAVEFQNTENIVQSRIHLVQGLVECLS